MIRRRFLHQSVAGMSGLLATPLYSAGRLDSLLKSLGTVESLSDAQALRQAKENIEKLRKREVRIQILNKEGQPLANHEVGIKQESHDFLFGDNNWSMATMIRNGTGEAPRLDYFRRTFSEIYNSLNVTLYWTERPRNDAVKTQEFQGEIRMEEVDESVDWALSQNMVAKGHPMFWTVPKALPDWLKKYPYETQMKFIEVRIRNLAARYKGKIKIWDAVNEMLWEPHPMNMAKREWPYFETMENMVDYISKILIWGREEDPAALFTINDYGLSKVKRDDLYSHNGEKVTTDLQRKRYLELANRLGDQGTPPNLLGLQCHTGWLKPSAQVEFYDQMSEANIPISITEFWARTSELKKVANAATESEEWRSFENSSEFRNMPEEELEEIRDKYVVDYLTCAFGHPNVHSFYFWGMIGEMIDFRRENGAGYELNPIFHKIHQLIHKEWKTNLAVKTDKKGILTFRGFSGAYSAVLSPERGRELGYGFHVPLNQQETDLVIKTVL